MKKLLLGSGLAALLALAGGAVQAADQQIELSATVTGFCTVGLATGSETQTITVTDGNPATSPIVNTYNVVCNSAADASLASVNDGLEGPAAQAGFANFINYNAATSGFIALSGTTTGSGTGVTLDTDSTLGASATPITVTITPIDPADPLLAGSYNDTLTLTITPDA